MRADMKDTAIVMSVLEGLALVLTIGGALYETYSPNPLPYNLYSKPYWAIFCFAVSFPVPVLLNWLAIILRRSNKVYFIARVFYVLGFLYFLISMGTPLIWFYPNS